MHAKNYDHKHEGWNYMANWDAAYFCKPALVAPIRFASCYFLFVIFRLISTWVLMCCSGEPGVIHHHARGLFTLIDFFLAPAMISVSMILSVYDGMKKECLDIKPLSAMQLKNPKMIKMLSKCINWDWDNLNCRPITRNHVDYVMNFNFYYLGIYGIILFILVLCSCCVMITHKSEARLEGINAAFDSKALDEINMAPGKGAVPLEKNREGNVVQPTYLERVTAIQKKRDEVQVKRG
jgi:hypothetical protein